MSNVFLTAEWRHLLMANYIVDPEVLKPHVPYGTELDFYNHNCYVSMVGFMFLNTKIKGLAIPFHRDFEEVNLRFYVRRKVAGEWRRGVVFIKEIVPKIAIAWTARLFYKEKYVYHPMKHKIVQADSYDVSYSWKSDNEWHHLSAIADPEGKAIREDSEEMFITEHYYGYSAYSENKTKEYHVDHPRWNVFNVRSFSFQANVSKLYGSEFKESLRGDPHSVFLLDGSDTRILIGDYLN